MGAIARNIANNITTSGVFTPDALDSGSVTGITALANASDGITLISSQTASASASISFTTGIDATYKAYKFVFTDINPVTDNTQFQFNMSTDGGSNYNVTKTTTFFYAIHRENDTVAALDYASSLDLAQSTSFQAIAHEAGNDADESIAGTLTLFNPSSEIFVKHFIGTNNHNQYAEYSINNFQAGYGNTTSAVNAIRFQMSSGNFDGTIYMYGIK